jgi:predicted phage tail protein
MMRTLRLYGPMGARFGRSHRFDLDSGTPAEAFAALMSQVAGVREYLAQAKEKGIGFAVFVGKRNLPAEHLTLPANDDIRVAPILLGAKSGGVLQILVGVVIIAVAYFNPFGYLTGPMVTAMYAAGAGMIAGGVVQLLTPAPKGISAKDGAANTPSYNFNGPVNTEAQGHPVPLYYGGPMTIGSAVASAGIDTVDTAYVPTYDGLIGFLKHGFMGGGMWTGSGSPRVVGSP